jgi:hypothetical protein
MAEAFVVVVDIHDDLILKIDDLILIVRCLDVLLPLPLQLGALLHLEQIDCLRDALD